MEALLLGGWVVGFTIYAICHIKGNHISGESNLSFELQKIKSKKDKSPNKMKLF